LFEKITRVNTRFCLKYNETIIFCVPKHLVSMVLRKKIKIIPTPQGIQHARKFIEIIANPVTFKDLEIKDDEIILTAGSQSKAALIGRNKRRLLEMQKIVKEFFGKEFRII